MGGAWGAGRLLSLDWASVGGPALRHELGDRTNGQCESCESVAKRGKLQGRWLGSDGAVRRRGPRPGLGRGWFPQDFDGILRVAIGDSVSSGWPASTLAGTGEDGRAGTGLTGEGRRRRAGEVSSAQAKVAARHADAREGAARPCPAARLQRGTAHSPGRGAASSSQAPVLLPFAGSSVCSQVSSGAVPTGSGQNEGGRELRSPEGGRGGHSGRQCLPGTDSTRGSSGKLGRDTGPEER